MSIFLFTQSHGKTKGLYRYKKKILKILKIFRINQVITINYLLWMEGRIVFSRRIEHLDSTVKCRIVT